VALDGPAGVRRARRAVLKAFRTQMDGKGYSLVEILSPCPVYLHCKPADGLAFVREKMVPVFPVRVFRENGQRVAPP
jgi:2-oxoglutarate ferredoxin oxidoreductase subunit beta